MKKVLFISSTGGHLEQLLHLEETMQSYHSFIVTEKNSITKKLRSKSKHQVHFVPYFSRRRNWFWIFIFIGIIFKSLYLFIKIRPDTIVSTGAGCVIPMFFIGKLFGKKLIFIETYSRRKSKTLSGRVCYPLCDTFLVQWKSLKEIYPKAKYIGPIY